MNVLMTLTLILIGTVAVWALIWCCTARSMAELLEVIVIIYAVARAAALLGALWLLRGVLA